MRTKNMLRTIIIFVVFTITGIALLELAPGFASAEAQRVLPWIGSGMFASALTFFLVEFPRASQS